MHFHEYVDLKEGKDTAKEVVIPLYHDVLGNLSRFNGTNTIRRLPEQEEISQREIRQSGSKRSGLQGRKKTAEGNRHAYGQTL